MSLIIIGELFTFPEGNAATNRVYNYALGFIENGLNAYVICFRNEYDEQKNGNIDGIEYFLPFSPKNRSKYYFVRVWYRYLKYFTTIRIIKEINKKDKVLAINCYSRFLGTRLFSFLLAKFLNAKLILESSEHPLQYIESSTFFNRLRAKLELQLALRLSDGVLCISRYLVEFYKNMGINPAKLFIVPSTVDNNRFKNVEISPRSDQYIAYCGDLSIAKDGVDILVKSFAAIEHKHPELFLVLIGKAYYPNDEAIIMGLVKEFQIEHKVIFLGQISRNDIPKYLNGAKILALSRPDSMIADAGFPSKLTEYLASGKPVVVTKVGEIDNYLADGGTAFLAEPDNVESFAGKLDYILENYPDSLAVAQRGKELSETVFNYNFQAKRVIDFLNELP